MHKGKFYQQHDGVSMGSPLGPTIANFFLAHMENKVLSSGLYFLPKLYLRYVDDIFAVFPDDKSCTSFLDLLNFQHKNIKFTAELAAETIPFLNVEIKLNDSGLDTWVWRKPTHTNLLLNFNAFCPLKWKSGLILCFLNRAKLICSNISLFQQESEKLKTMFKANDYPGRFFDKILQQFLKSDKNQSSNSTQPPQSAYEYAISLPYLGKASQRFVNWSTNFPKSSISNYIKMLKLIPYSNHLKSTLISN